MIRKKSYEELMTYDSFQSRIRYLMIDASVGDFTFGGHRQLNQMLYKMKDWKHIRRDIIIRDQGFDLGHPDHPIEGDIYVHHINPITIEDILERRSCVWDPDNLISTSFNTHNLIHYGNEEGVRRTEVIERTKNDTCPWRC